MAEGRTIAIGDIHGCSAALDALLKTVAPAAEDVLVFLGDYIDRGPDSRGVVECVLALQERCAVVPLLGNHEELLLAAVRDHAALRPWLANGGVETLRSYGWAPGGPRRVLADWFPRRHLDFLAGCRDYYETISHFFAHAFYEPRLPLAGQPWAALRWASVPPRPERHCSGKVAVVGHTAQRSGEVLDLGCLICIDTNCHRRGWLTALDVGTGRLWQANQHGQLRG